MRRKILTIAGDQGLHIRAATALARLAGRFRSRITLERNGSSADAQSILELLLLAAGSGCRVRITVSGDDEGEALAAVEKLFLSGFHPG